MITGPNWLMANDDDLSARRGLRHGNCWPLKLREPPQVPHPFQLGVAHYIRPCRF